MRSLMEDIAQHGVEALMGPDRFREFLVIAFTGIGEHPGEVLQTMVAWGAALFVADRIYPRKK